MGVSACLGKFTSGDANSEVQVSRHSFRKMEFGLEGTMARVGVMPVIPEEIAIVFR
jgi:hypothetical protein